ncbi:MAG: cell envelope integrity protein CreD [Bacteroidetes bacterium HGW-Bacteroidetes-21]|nr:MAG: cell envelope integrity protein CreD [Bacteroidetes bacterium HGW-Bacteroidetes-21]
MNLFIKAAIIFGLIVILMIPTLLIMGLISEREQRQQEAVYEVSSKWAGQQTLTGPILSVPYYTYYTDENQIVRKRLDYATFLPEDLNADCKVFPEKRHRGIYEVVVYNSDISVSGKFSLKEIVVPDVPVEQVMYDKAFVSLGINDLRGLQKQVTLNWDSLQYQFQPGAGGNPVIYSGISTPVKMNPEELNDTTTATIEFTANMQLKGSEKLYFVPVGKQTLIKMNSDWKDPSFDGAFLPDTSNIAESGFVAEWSVLNLNRNFPQSWTGNNYNLEESAFGVYLIVPADNYLKSSRSIKYAILVILLTFIVFFFIEMLNNKPMHVLSYALVGAALCVFYTLLISISEYLNFGYAYLIASVMTVGMITTYVHSFIKTFKLTMLVFTLLSLLYLFIFTIIQLQDYALLMGSLGIFIILAILMYFSRKISFDKQ